MSFVKSLMNMVERGRQGKNKGLSMGLPKFESIVDGVQKATYTVLAGGTGSGKTTLALYAYVYRPIVDKMAMKDTNYKVLYYSLEMSAEVLLAKVLSLHLFETYNVELSYKDIVSKKEILADDMYELVVSCTEWLEEFMKYIIIYDKNLNADALYANLMEFAKKNGRFEEGENTTKYVPHNPDLLVMLILDHVGLLRRNGGRSKKEEIDLASNYIIFFKLKCGYSGVALIQLNRTSSSMDRRNAEMQEIQLDDLKDSGGPSEDAELVIAIFNPFREKMARYKAYNIKILRDKFRAVQVLKNRFGEADKSVAINFFGSVGFWRELPKAEEMNQLAEEQYKPYLSLLLNKNVKDTVVKTGEKPVFRFQL